MTDHPAATFDDSYSAWKNWTRESFATLTPAAARYFDAELARLGPRRIRHALEIGFGNGTFLRYARDRGWDVSGTEAIPGLVERAREAGFDAHAADALDRLAAARFDLIVAFDVLEHIPQQHIPPFLRSLARLLAPGGSMLFRFPNADSPFGRPYQHGDVTHCTYVGEAKLRHLARVSGLTVVAFRGEVRRDDATDWRSRLARLGIRLLERTVEPCIMYGLFPGWSFALFSPNSVAVLEQAVGSPAP
jgi:SAM-dependent methyltransferase